MSPRRSRRQLLADIDLLRWLHAEQTARLAHMTTMCGENRRLAAVRKTELESTKATLEAVETAADRWQALAQSATRNPGAIIASSLHVPDRGIWSAQAVAILIEEYQAARTIVAELQQALSRARCQATTLREIGMFSPVHEKVVSILDHILTAQKQGEDRDA